MNRAEAMAHEGRKGYDMAQLGSKSAYASGVSEDKPTEMTML